MTLLNIRQKVLDAALVLFNQTGFEKTTITEIRELAGASNGAVFHHFKSKDAIAEALFMGGIESFQAGLAEILQTPTQDVEAALRAAVRHHLQWNESHRELSFFMYNRGRPGWAPGSGEQVQRLNRDIAARIREWLAPFIASGEMRPVSTSVLAACVVGPTHFVAQRWLSGQITATPTSFADELGDAACAALLIRHPKRSRSRTATDVAAQANTGPVRTTTIAEGRELLQSMLTGDRSLPAALATLNARLIDVGERSLRLLLPCPVALATGEIFADHVITGALSAVAELASWQVCPTQHVVAVQQAISISRRPSCRSVEMLTIDAQATLDNDRAATTQVTLTAGRTVLARISVTSLI